MKFLKIFRKRRRRSDKWPWSKKENVKQRTPLEPGCEIKQGLIVKTKICMIIDHAENDTKKYLIILPKIVVGF